MAHHLAVEGVAALGRTPAFIVEGRGDHRAVLTPPVKLAGAGDKARIGAEGLQLGDGPYQLMRGSVAAMPMALQPDLLAVADDSDDDALQQEASDRLTLLLGRRLGPPEGG